jgi:hypothetical protein
MVNYFLDPLVSAQNTYERIFFAFNLSKAPRRSKSEAGIDKQNTMKRRNLFLLLAATIIYAVISPTTVDASVKTSAPSALLIADLRAHTPQKMVVDNRAKILREYLESYDSPLAPHAATFIQEADKHDLDWKLVPAITGLESYFGHMIPPYSYNGWGYHVYNGNVRGFESWDAGIEVVSNDLRKIYMDQWGAQNVYQIGSRYAADPNWANKVTHFMNELEAFEKSYNNTSVSISI